MIVDSSALIAIVQGEDDSDRLARVLLDGSARMSVANWLECCLVADSRSSTHQDNVQEVLRLAEIELVPVTVEQARVAREAHRRFGRGSGSRARLNFGDCFAYALAITTGDSLLYKGDDFSHTDVRPAWLSDGEA